MTPRGNDQHHQLKALRTPAGLQIEYRHSKWLQRLIRINTVAWGFNFAGWMPAVFWLVGNDKGVYAEGSRAQAMVDTAAIAGLSVAALSFAVILLLRCAAPMRVKREGDLTIESVVTIDRNVLAVKDRSVHDTAEFQVAIPSVFGVYIHGGIGGTQRGMLEIELQNGDSHLLLMRAPLSVIEVAAEAIIDELEYAAMVRDIDGGHGQLPLFGRRAA